MNGVGEISFGFRPQDLSKAVRPPFIGMVVYAEFPCDCVVCRKGKERLEQIGGRTRTERVHLIIKPLTQFTELQHAWYNISKIMWSAFGGFVIALSELGFATDKEKPEEQWKDVQNFLLGKVFEWRSENPVKFVEELTGEQRPKRLPPALVEAKEQWFPVRVVPESELVGYDLKALFEEGKEQVKELFRRMEAGEIQVEEFEPFEAFQ